MPLLNEIARITGGRIFMKDSISYAEYSRQKKDAEGDLKEAQKNGDSKEISRLETLLKEIDADYNTKDSVLSDLVGLAKKAGEALMEPTEKAAAGDTKDADTEWFLENEDTGKKVKGPFATEQEAISVHRSLRGSYKEWEKLFVTEERKG
uniref:Uncharacterized protein n=1 Tax=viral metagenome TaxID=1070528 RepID=A0A6M3MBA5_9ZZZZ